MNVVARATVVELSAYTTGVVSAAKSTVAVGKASIEVLSPSEGIHSSGFSYSADLDISNVTVVSVTLNPRSESLSKITCPIISDVSVSVVVSIHFELVESNE